jgi:hypothetical protein
MPNEVAEQSSQCDPIPKPPQVSSNEIVSVAGSKPLVVSKSLSAQVESDLPPDLSFAQFASDIDPVKRKYAHVTIPVARVIPPDSSFGVSDPIVSSADRPSRALIMSHTFEDSSQLRPHSMAVSRDSFHVGVRRNRLEMGTDPLESFLGESVPTRGQFLMTSPSYSINLYDGHLCGSHWETPPEMSEVYSAYVTSDGTQDLWLDNLVQILDVEQQSPVQFRMIQRFHPFDRDDGGWSQQRRPLMTSHVSHCSIIQNEVDLTMSFVQSIHVPPVVRPIVETNLLAFTGPLYRLALSPDGEEGAPTTLEDSLESPFLRRLEATSVTSVEPSFVKSTSLARSERVEVASIEPASNGRPWFAPKLAKSIASVGSLSLPASVQSIVAPVPSIGQLGPCQALSTSDVHSHGRTSLSESEFSVEHIQQIDVLAESRRAEVPADERSDESTEPRELCVAPSLYRISLAPEMESTEESPVAVPATDSASVPVFRRLQATSVTSIGPIDKHEVVPLSLEIIQVIDIPLFEPTAASHSPFDMSLPSVYSQAAFPHEEHPNESALLVDMSSSPSPIESASLFQAPPIDIQILGHDLSSFMVIDSIPFDLPPATDVAGLSDDVAASELPGQECSPSADAVRPPELQLTDSHAVDIDSSPEPDNAITSSFVADIRPTISAQTPQPVAPLDPLPPSIPGDESRPPSLPVGDSQPSSLPVLAVGELQILDVPALALDDPSLPAARNGGSQTHLPDLTATFFVHASQPPPIMQHDVRPPQFSRTHVFEHTTTRHGALAFIFNSGVVDIAGTRRKALCLSQLSSSTSEIPRSSRSVLHTTVIDIARPLPALQLSLQSFEFVRFLATPAVSPGPRLHVEPTVRARLPLALSHDAFSICGHEVAVAQTSASVSTDDFGCQTVQESPVLTPSHLVEFTWEPLLDSTPGSYEGLVHRHLRELQDLTREVASKDVQLHCLQQELEAFRRSASDSLQRHCVKEIELMDQIASLEVANHNLGHLLTSSERFSEEKIVKIIDKNTPTLSRVAQLVVELQPLHRDQNLEAAEQPPSRATLRTTGKITHVSAVPKAAVVTLAISSPSHIVDWTERKASMEFHFTHFRVATARLPPVLHLQALPNIATFRPNAADRTATVNIEQRIQEKDAFIAGLTARLSILNQQLGESKRRETELTVEIARMRKRVTA